MKRTHIALQLEGDKWYRLHDRLGYIDWCVMKKGYLSSQVTNIP